MAGKIIKITRHQTLILIGDAITVTLDNHRKIVRVTAPAEMKITHQHRRRELDEDAEKQNNSEN